MTEIVERAESEFVEPEEDEDAAEGRRRLTKLPPRKLWKRTSSRRRRSRGSERRDLRMIPSREADGPRIEARPPGESAESSPPAEEAAGKDIPLSRRKQVAEEAEQA